MYNLARSKDVDWHILNFFVAVPSRVWCSSGRGWCPSSCPASSGGCSGGEQNFWSISLNSPNWSTVKFFQGRPSSSISSFFEGTRNGQRKNPEIIGQIKIARYATEKGHKVSQGRPDTGSELS